MVLRFQSLEVERTRKMEGYWAQCQLYTRIRFIPRGLLLMNLQGGIDC